MTGTGQIRRAQLIAPFGVGAMTVLADGVGVLGAGLDHWFKRQGGDDTDVDQEEFRVEEWRLQAALGVECFRLPPDWRWNAFRMKPVPDNLGLPVPFLRFPSWNFCRFCNRLSRLPLSYREQPRCRYCAKAGKKGPALAQVPFVAVCDYGHLQDFPFAEWVHKSSNPSCGGILTLKGTGAASLTAQVLECTCTKRRTMGGVTAGNPATGARGASSYLSDNLLEGDREYTCPGVSAWHGSTVGTGCGQPLRGSLRAASNVYYALVRSAIYLPRDSDIDPKLAEILTETPLGPVVQMLRDFGEKDISGRLRVHASGKRLLAPYSNAALESALESLASRGEEVPPNPFDDAWDEVAFRRPEYRALSRSHDSADLKIGPPAGDYAGITGSHLAGIMLAERLRETRALYGFNRINAENNTSLTDRKSLLRKSREPLSWLPAYVVNGEGLFLGLEPRRLAEWESRSDVVERVARLEVLYEKARQQRPLRERTVSARFVVLHTLSHLVMNQLTFTCGYSSASLRERMFVDEEMASVLIYTAAGDAEGTMGGLVRMGRPGLLEPVLEEALAGARWCSADPICMECGDSGGQGPDSCNLAACHSCSLVPETACEEFNRFLDRGLVSGTLAQIGLGFFPGTPTFP